jgi:hypothetical protein
MVSFQQIHYAPEIPRLQTEAKEKEDCKWRNPQMLP